MARYRDRPSRKASRSLEGKGEKGNGRVIDRFEIEIDAIGDFKLMSVRPLQELKIQLILCRIYEFIFPLSLNL